MPLITILFSSMSAPLKAVGVSSLSTYLKVNHIIQDKNDYIWLAGHNGLTRLDGENMINFSGYNEYWNIPFTWVHDVTKEDQNFIITTENHQLWQFNPETGIANKINLNLNLKNKNIYNTNFFQGSYYFNTSNQVYVHQPKDKSTLLLAENIHTAYIRNTNKNLYVSGRNGLFKLQNNSFTLILDEDISSIEVIKEGILVLTKDKIIYLGDDGLHSEKVNTTKKLISSKSNDGNALLLNKQGEISKLEIPSLNELKHYYPKIEALIPKNLIQDSSNTLWINSNKGMKKISPTFIKNNHKIYNVANNANEIELFDNEFVIGTYGDGIHAVNENNLDINKHLTSLGKKTMDLLTIKESLYIATFDGLWVYNKLKKTIKKIDFLNNKIILKLTKSQNYLYIATNDNGFYIYNLKTQRIIEHVDINQGISSAEIIDIMTLDNHNIWLATPNGIDIYNKYTKTTRQIKLPINNKVISFATHNNKVYASTKGDGIFVLNFHGDVLSRIAKGIDFSMLATINEEVWAPARQGLYRINTINNSISLVPDTEKYTFTDRPIKYKDTVYIPHYTGLLEVPLTQREQFNPRIAISQVTVSGKSTLTQESINVNSENDVISLSLSSLDFRSGKPKQFKYKINNGIWNNIQGSQLTLTGLQSGSYKLAIKGTNSLGQWSSKQAFTQIKVAYLWYLTPQMQAIYTLGIILIIVITGWLLLLRFRSINKIHSILSNEIKSNSKINFNLERNLIKVKELLTHDIDKLEAEQLYQASQILSGCIESLTDDENNNNTEPKSIQGKSLEVALPYFINYVEQKYHSNVLLKLDIPESRLSQEIQADLYKIIYETIISTIINGSGRNYEIMIQEFKQKLWLTITNDENGFVKFKNKINFDMSMYYIRQIASKYNASVNVFDKDTSGCQLIISIPLMDIYN